MCISYVMDVTIGTDLSEIERKMGREIPESLFPFAPDGRMMKDNTHGRDEWDWPGHVEDMPSTQSLQSNMRLLRQEMVSILFHLYCVLSVYPSPVECLSKSCRVYIQDQETVNPRREE